MNQRRLCLPSSLPPALDCQPDILAPEQQILARLQPPIELGCTEVVKSRLSMLLASARKWVRNKRSCSFSLAPSSCLPVNSTPAWFSMVSKKSTMLW